MGIIDKYIILQNIKGRKSMFSSSKTLDLEENYSKLRESLFPIETKDLQLLLDWYILYDDEIFDLQMRAIKDELAFRNTSLGKELR